MAEEKQNDKGKGMLLAGLDGSNPLAFLAALGLIQTIQLYDPKEKPLMYWTRHAGAWRPVLLNKPIQTDCFCESLEQTLKNLDTTPFNIDDKLPFEASKLRQESMKLLRTGHYTNRRTLDILSAFGSDAYVNNEGIFQDTRLRMIRSADVVGNGLPAYSREICKETSAKDLQRTLFHTWDYADEGRSLRLDPNEDRQYALRAGDPSKESVMSMRGANRLAIEGMALMYTAPVGRSLASAGFSEFNKKIYYTWPLWETPIALDTIKSIVTSKLLQRENMDKRYMSAMGVVAVFRCRRFATSKYYNNFSPSFSIL